MFTILFLCTGNSCRSIIAEAMTNQSGIRKKVKAISAGSSPTGTVHPMAINTLKKQGIATEGLHSKSWDEFKEAQVDIVITLCDSAAGEACPVFPGNPVRVHWSTPDPADVPESAAEPAFRHVYSVLQRRIIALLALPLATMDKEMLKERLERIGTNYKA